MSDSQVIYQHDNFYPLVISAVGVYLVLLLMSWIVNISLLPLVVLLVLPVVYFVLNAFIKPYLWIFLIVAGLYAGNALHLFEGFTVPFSLFQLFFLSGIFLLFLNRIYTGEFRFRLSGLELEFALFAALMFLSIIYSPEPDDGLLFAVRTVITGILLYFILNVINRDYEIILIMVFVTLAGLILAFFSVRDGLMNPEAAIMSAVSGGAKLFTRAATTQSDPNVFATYFFMPIAFCSCIIASKIDFRYRTVAIIVFPVLTLGLISTFSRSSWVSAIFMLLIIAVFYRQFKLFIWMGILGIIAIILLPDFRVTAINIIQRFTDIFAGATDDSSRMRVVQMYAAFHMFFDSYMVGVGLRGYAVSILDYHTYQELIGIVLPHNVTYTILAELGLIGISLFLFIIYRITRDAYLNIIYSYNESTRIVATTLFASLIAFFLFYQFIGGGLIDNNIWLIIGLIYATRYILLSRMSQT